MIEKSPRRRGIAAKSKLLRSGRRKPNFKILQFTMEMGEYGWCARRTGATRYTSVTGATTIPPETDASRTNDTRRARTRTPTIDGDLRHRPPLHKTSKISIEGDSAPTEQAHRQRVVMGTPARGPMAAEEQDETKISSPHHQHPNLKNQADIVGHSRRHPTSIRNPRNEALLSQEEPVVTEMVEEL